MSMDDIRQRRTNTTSLSLWHFNSGKTHRSREYNTGCQDLGLGSKYGEDFSVGRAEHI